jgi:hypothetical protein
MTEPILLVAVLILGILSGFVIGVAYGITLAKRAMLHVIREMIDRAVRKRR